MAKALRLFGSPVLFFRGVADSDIDWLSAVLPLALYVGGASVMASVVVAGQAEGAMLVIALIVSVMSSFVGTLVVFWSSVTGS